MINNRKHRFIQNKNLFEELIYSSCQKAARRQTRREKKIITTHIELDEEEQIRELDDAQTYKYSEIVELVRDDTQMKEEIMKQYYRNIRSILKHK